MPFFNRKDMTKIDQLRLLMYISITVIRYGSDGLDCNVFIFVCLSTIYQYISFNSGGWI